MTRPVPPSSPVTTAVPAPVTAIPSLDVDSVAAMPVAKPAANPADNPVAKPTAKPADRSVTIGIDVVNNAACDDNDHITLVVYKNTVRISESYIDFDNNPAKSVTTIDKDDLRDYLKAYIVFGLMDPRNHKIAMSISFLPRITLSREEMKEQLDEILYRISVITDIIY